MSEDLTLEAFLEFLSSVESGIASAREMVKVQKIEYDMEQIPWQETEGQKGRFEKASKTDNQHYKALVEDLKAHGGKFRKAGYFVWLFKDNKTIGRKKV